MEYLNAGGDIFGFFGVEYLNVGGGIFGDFFGGKDSI